MDPRQVSGAINGEETATGDPEELERTLCRSASQNSLNGDKMEELIDKFRGQERMGSASSSTGFPRIVRKDGNYEFTGKGLGNDFYFQDIFTTLLEIRWRYLLLAFCLVYFSSWLLFAGIWYALLYFHGDFTPENLGNSSWTPCITELRDFIGTFLFSVETQHTTGYGYYHLTEECFSTIIVFCIQSIVGCIFEGVLVGLIFVKIARGKKRRATLLFSKYAVVHKAKDGLAFAFRVADLRNKSNLLETRIRAHLITWVKCEESDKLGSDLKMGNYFLRKEKLKVLADGGDETDFFLSWPARIIHHITPSSPMSKFFEKEGKLESHFEVIVVLEGIVDATGQMTQALTSFIPSEVFHDHTFKPLEISTKLSNEIDYSNFHEIVPVSDHISSNNNN